MLSADVDCCIFPTLVVLGLAPSLLHMLLPERTILGTTVAGTSEQSMGTHSNASHTDAAAGAAKAATCHMDHTDPLEQVIPLCHPTLSSHSQSRPCTHTIPIWRPIRTSWSVHGFQAFTGLMLPVQCSSLHIEDVVWNTQQ